MVESGKVYGFLAPKWYWNDKSGERFWKCTCLLCHSPCYVKERALDNRIVVDCGCKK